MPPTARLSRALRRASPLAGAPIRRRTVAVTKPHSNGSSCSGPGPADALSLETFASDLVHGLLQHDDALFEHVYARDFSRELDET